MLHRSKTTQGRAHQTWLHEYAPTTSPSDSQAERHAHARPSRTNYMATTRPTPHNIVPRRLTDTHTTHHGYANTRTAPSPHDDCGKARDEVTPTQHNTAHGTRTAQRTTRGSKPTTPARPHIKRHVSADGHANMCQLPTKLFLATTQGHAHQTWLREHASASVAT